MMREITCFWIWAFINSNSYFFMFKKPLLKCLWVNFFFLLQACYLIYLVYYMTIWRYRRKGLTSGDSPRNGARRDGRRRAEASPWFRPSPSFSIWRTERTKSKTTNHLDLCNWPCQSHSILLSVKFILVSLCGEKSKNHCEIRFYFWLLLW